MFDRSSTDVSWKSCSQIPEKMGPSQIEIQLVLQNSFSITAIISSLVMFQMIYWVLKLLHINTLVNALLRFVWHHLKIPQTENIKDQVKACSDLLLWGLKVWIEFLKIFFFVLVFVLYEIVKRIIQKISQSDFSARENSLLS